MVATRSSRPASSNTYDAYTREAPKRKQPPTAASDEEVSTCAAKKARPTVAVPAAAAKVVEVQVAAGKVPNPRFRPRSISHRKPTKVPVVEGKVPRGASILIIQRPWIDLILDGYKTLEIRGKKCVNKVGERIYLALSGGGGVLLGSVYFKACHGPLSRAEWASRGEEHCVAGDALPYGSSTHAWQLVEPRRFSAPVPYFHKPGIVVWAIKD